MLDHRGFSAWITSDGLELVEFEPRVNDQAHTVTCWIAGSVGQPFIVHWRDHGSLVDSASWIYFDGFKVSGQFLHGSGEELRRGVRVGSEEERPFVFSSIDHTDPLGTIGGRPTDKNIGSIVLEIRLIKLVGEREPNILTPPPDVVRGNRLPGEVAIRYGDVRPASMQKRTYKIEPFDTNAPGPYVTFIFRYRSKDWLVSQGIVGDDEVTSRLLILPDVEDCSQADLPPLEPEEDEDEDEDEDESASPSAGPPVPTRVASGTHVTSSGQSPEQEPGPSLATSNPPTPGTAPKVKMEELGLGHRPQAPTGMGRVSSTSSSHSFSGTWDPSPSGEPYEEWNEYRPEELDEALDNYF
ncbi:hypothetical protein BD311DRAFT_793163 [Dichomitus squalens]|uniref:DUF7918 domain-containing protein n=1 Tax=Dichomitus squalens TaxID=114155 RepID=A0A4Q9N790_9APHY|nr:hypothetical protein BD311DRAFT_793163 [Dichomitus squalens]